MLGIKIRGFSVLTVCRASLKSLQTPSRFYPLSLTSSKMSTPSETPSWAPPAKIEELFAKTAGNQFAAINSPTAGARVQQDLPVGTAALQLYSLGTPNGK